MRVSYRNQVAITDFLIQRLEVGLSGREQPECLDRLPHDRFHLGVLAPQHYSGEAMSQPLPENEQNDHKSQDQIVVEVESILGDTSPENGDAEAAEYSPSEIENEDTSRLSREDILTKRGAPSALGIEFMVNVKGKFELELSADFAIYTRRFPTWMQIEEFAVSQDQTSVANGSKSVSIRDRYVRHEIHIDSIIIPISPQTAILPKTKTPFDLKIDALLNQERHQIDVWRQVRPMTIPLSAISDEDTYQDYLAKLKQEVEVPPLAVYIDIRTLSMPNGHTRVSVYLVNGTPADESSIISNAARYIIDASFSCKVDAELAPIEIVSAAEDYQYDPNVWVVGQGCSARILNYGRPWLITTEALAKFDQPRLVTRNEPATPFEGLNQDPLPLLEAIYDEMERYGENWKTKLESGQLNLRDSSQENACLDDLNKFYDEMNRFRQGIAALQSDNRLLIAFKAMHRVFERVGRSRNITSWRLFQLGFIVTQLPSLAVREGFETNTLDYADVLWFPTGGGKTEAYLGLICCALLYDRLRGKSNGVTAWLRFPLRMLSVQQLQRAVKVIYEAEVERQALFEENVGDSAPFALGYLVGKSSTPNKLSEANWEGQWKLSNLSARQDLRDKLRLIRECPRCGKTAVEVIVDAKKARIFHICQACKLDLNIMVSDDEIFRYLPSVLIGTVDKLPSVAWRREFAHIWGNVESWCPEHGFSSGKYCMVFGCKEQRTAVQLNDPGPSLQIQDELHLLREELGTFAGHYETLATVCQSRIAQPPKILAATATVEGLERQSPHLYNLLPRRFPGRGYKLGESFYAEYATDDGHPHIGRRFLAFKPPSLRPPEASTDVLEILHSEIRGLYLILQEQGLEALAKMLTVDFIDYNEAIELLDKYDTTLTYVNSKAHGSRIERELTGRSRDLPKAGNRNIEISYLNGESTLDDIATTIDSLEADVEWDDDKKLDAVIGTSLISHGVDVSRFNLMVMSGMPGRTAEYIQSSSRSGRTYLGIVIVVLSPWLLREQSVFHRFETYHYHMEHLVEPVPINRFSRFAADKTLPGLLAGILNAYFGPQLKADLSRTQEVQKAIYQDARLTEEQILLAVKQAFAIDSPLYTESLRLSLNDRVQQRFKTEIRRLSQPGAPKRVTDALSRQPMSSLRDVDAPVPFDPKEYSYSKLRWLQ